MSILTLLISFTAIFTPPDSGRIDSVMIYNDVRGTYQFKQLKIDTGRTPSSYIPSYKPDALEAVQLPTATSLDSSLNGFTRFVEAGRQYDIEKYPFSTSVKLYRYKNGYMDSLCSGSFIGRDKVITANHCVYRYIDKRDTLSLADSIYVSPSYKNYEVPDRNNLHRATRYHINEKVTLSRGNRDNFLRRFGDYPIILQMEKSPGDKNGWLGLECCTTAEDTVNDEFMYAFGNPSGWGIDSTRYYHLENLYFGFGYPGNREWGDRIHIDKPVWKGFSGSPIFEIKSSNYLIRGITAYVDRQGTYFHTIPGDQFLAYRAVVNEDYVITGMAGNSKHRPDRFALSDNYPNPFNPTTTINYNLPKTTEVNLSVYNLLGKRVAMLEKGRKQPGRHTVRFHARGLTSGVYIYKLQTESFSQSKKMILIK